MKRFVAVRFLDGKYAIKTKVYYFATYVEDLQEGEKVIVDTRYGLGIATIVAYVSERTVKEKLGDLQIKEVVARCDTRQCETAKRNATDVAMLQCKVHMARLKLQDAMKRNDKVKAGKAAAEYCEVNAELKDKLKNLSTVQANVFNLDIGDFKDVPVVFGTQENVRDEFITNIMRAFMKVD